MVNQQGFSFTSPLALATKRNVSLSFIGLCLASFFLGNAGPIRYSVPEKISFVEKPVRSVTLQPSTSTRFWKPLADFSDARFSALAVSQCMTILDSVFSWNRSNPSLNSKVRAFLIFSSFLRPISLRSWLARLKIFLSNLHFSVIDFYLTNNYRMLG